ncbi:MAG: hypothetical protein WC091_10920 [Sulfuricellaceae bacterium]
MQARALPLTLEEKEQPARPCAGFFLFGEEETAAALTRKTYIAPTRNPESKKAIPKNGLFACLFGCGDRI